MIWTTQDLGEKYTEWAVSIMLSLLHLYFKYETEKYRSISS